MENSGEEAECYAPSKQQLFSHKWTDTYPLSDEQMEFLNEHGYLVLKGLVDKDSCEDIIAQSFQRARKTFGLQKTNEDTWKNLNRHGFCDLWHLPGLYELRQSPIFYSIFAQLLGTHKLCAAVDRIGMKPPCRDPTASNDTLTMHTDLNYWYTRPELSQYQGGLCLADCPIGGGGFFCVPEFQKKEVIQQYKTDYKAGKFGKRSIPPASNRFIPFLDQEYVNAKKLEIPLCQGDFVIWNSNLPHNGGINTLPNHWRLHTYVRFLALDGPCVNSELAKWNLEYQKITLQSMKTGATPAYFSTGNVIRAQDPNIEVPMHQVPKLTPLGERIWGVKPWDKDE